MRSLFRFKHLSGLWELEEVATSEIVFPFVQDFLEEKRGALYVLSDSHVRLRDPLAILCLSRFFAAHGVDLRIAGVLAEHRRSFDETDILHALEDAPDLRGETQEIFKRSIFRQDQPQRNKLRPREIGFAFHGVNIPQGRIFGICSCISPLPASGPEGLRPGGTEERKHDQPSAEKTMFLYQTGVSLRDASRHRI